ncbi:MAG: hypothetical protein MPN21_04160 [Thermoanaerobaculia bacterium]|nr:hypothetical protein [Thermoanaerobaculia bacterium]
MSDARQLVADIERFVRDAEGSFEVLAHRAFALQYARVEPFRRLCGARGVDPQTMGDWRAIPPVPTAAFRSLALHVEPARELFRSSGTTGGPGSRSVHHHPFPHLYRAVIDASFSGACLPEDDRRPILSLVPSRDQAPDSSLGFHCDHVLRSWGAEGSLSAFCDRGVDIAAALAFLRDADRQPVTILTTAFALAQLLEALEGLGGVRLAAGSTMMETGGFKGRRKELSRPELLLGVERWLGLPADRVVREYGMTELTGHVYSDVLHGGDPDVFRVPHWMRVRLLDPVSLHEVPRGEEGLVAVVDLANVGSALHVVSQDVGTSGEDLGHDGAHFRLVGRAAGADLRGCSLTVEELTG